MEKGMDIEKTSLKCVFLGDSSAEKAVLLLTFCQGEYPEDYVPTVFDNFQKQMFYKTRKFTLQLWDTSGQEEFGKLRTMSFPDTDCFVICFSLVDKDTLTNVYEKWYKYLLAEKMISVPILLVGTKYELWKDEEHCKEMKEEKGEDFQVVDDGEAEEMLKKIGGFKYVQVSAKTGYNLEVLFQSIVDHLAERELAKIEKPEDSKKKKKGLGGLFASLSNRPLMDELAAINIDIPDDEDDEDI